MFLVSKDKCPCTWDETAVMLKDDFSAGYQVDFLDFFELPLVMCITKILRPAHFVRKSSTP